MEDVNQEIWQAVLGELELSLSKASFTTWLKNTFIIENEDGRIVVGVPNTFSQAWLKQKYHTEIYRIIQNKSKERIKEITYKVQTVKNYQQEQDQIKKTIIAEARQYQADVKTRPAIGEQAIGLNTKYCFDTFVVGKGNELVHAAAKAVAEKPGITYNPLFIYGGVGLGKTHIMQAIGHEILKNSPEKKVVYVTCEHQNDKQIVLTSDRPPKAIATLEDRLLSRFEWGMIADISQPDLETRIAILETKCVEKNFPLERDIIQYITLNIQNNIRELEGALNKIIAHHQLNHITPTLENVKKILFSISSASKQSGAVSARQLIELVSEFYDLTLEELLGKSREKRLAFPRQIIMYLLREELRCSYPTIGHELGGRDHTTAMHAYEKISGIIEDDEKLRQEINLIKQKVYAH